MRLATLAEIQRSLVYSEIIDCMRDALVAHSRGECETPMPMHLDIAPERAEVHIKSSYRRGGRYFALKIAGTFPGNAARGLSTGSGMMLLSSAETGEPVAFLADSGHLTDVRTAAVAAMVARELGRTDSTLGILGTGRAGAPAGQHACRSAPLRTHLDLGPQLRARRRMPPRLARPAAGRRSPGGALARRGRRRIPPADHLHRLARAAAARAATCNRAPTSPPSARIPRASRNSIPRSCAAPSCFWRIRAANVRSWVNCSMRPPNGAASIEIGAFCERAGLGPRRHHRLRLHRPGRGRSVHRRVLPEEPSFEDRTV